MNLRRALSLLSLVATALVVVAMTADSADAGVHRVRAGESIQAAIDAAGDGDTILVDPGTYQEDPTSLYGLRITQNRLRLVGRVRPGKGEAGKVRILANGDQETGIYAAPAGCEYKDTACAETLKGFYVRGFTVEGFPVNGIQTRWVDGFTFIRNESVNNLNNGIYPTLSANGLVANNVSYGSLDTAMWVAGSENVRVVGNEVYGSPRLGVPPIPVLPGVDILYIQTPPPAGPEPGVGNCFKKNRPSTFTFFSSEPDGLLPTDGC